MSRLNETDTIIAIATPPGRGGLGVVRLSGPEAWPIASALTGVREDRPGHVRRGEFRDGGWLLDSVLVVCFRAPRSYTGEDVAEISGHGSPVLLRSIVQAAVRHGARVADPGEFTRRAFLNGRMDLAQAEAVRDLIAAQTIFQARTAARQLNGSVSHATAPVKQQLKELIARLEAGIDFADDDVPVLDRSILEATLQSIRSKLAGLLRGFDSARAIREGLSVAIVGRPNVGKSSLFNRLLAADRAIVTDTPGTTRDLIGETADIAGIPVRLLDTAGLRTPESEPERLGIERSEQALADAELAIVVVDGSQPLTEEDRRLLTAVSGIAKLVPVINKRDLAPAFDPREFEASLPNGKPEMVSALTGEGLAELRERLANLVLDGVEEDGDFITNERHARHLRAADAALERAQFAADSGIPDEAVLVDVYDSLGQLDAITGQTTVEDILGLIFSTFCIGK
jgi:tRNA modification GTPase